MVVVMIGAMVAIGVVAVTVMITIIMAMIGMTHGQVPVSCMVT